MKNETNKQDNDMKLDSIDNGMNIDENIMNQYPISINSNPITEY